MQLRYILLSGFVALAAAAAVASEPLADVARRIGASNPEVVALASEHSAEIARERAVNTLQGPEVEFGYKFNNTAGGDDRWGLSVVQGFDWPGVYGARRQARRYREGAFSALLADRVMESTVAAAEAIADLCAARQRLATLEGVEADYGRLRGIYAAAYERNLVTVMSVRKLDIETFALDRRIAEARAAVAAAESRVRAMGADPAAVAVESPAIPSLEPLEAYRSRMASGDYGLQAASLMQDAATADVRAARRAALPSFAVGYTHDYEERQHFNGFTVGISLPSWAPRASITAAMDDAKARATAASITLAQRTAALDADYTEATAMIAALTRAEATFAADDYPAILRTLFDRGELTMPQYLYEYIEYVDARLEYIDMQWRLAAAAVRLNRYNLLPQ